MKLASWCVATSVLWSMGCEDVPMAPMPSDAGACVAAEERCNGIDDDCDERIDEATDLKNDAENCGECGHVCEAPNAVALCEAGLCTDTLTCNPGYGDCDGEPRNGCEVELVSMQNCGACDRLCEPDNATAACMSGQCEIIGCNDLFEDCDGNADNGCEATLAGSETCGTCDVSCSGPTPLCSVGPSGPECVNSCPDSRDVCDGRCVMLQTDVEHCGTCGVACSFDHALALCVGGACEIGACLTGWGDCDEDPSNGCETSTGASGRCNAPPLASLAVTCTQLNCTFDASASVDPDRGIVWYEFEFGDGASTSGMNPIVSHRFAAPGMFTASVTVSDGDGAMASTMQPARPTNLPPVASFTVVCTWGSCVFDAAGSTDPDGPIASYAWGFGDGTMGTGRTVTHNYGSTASYDATLSVTDDGGLTDMAMRTTLVTVPIEVAVDHFERATTNGWGSANLGGTYSALGEASAFSVSGGVGHINIPVAGSGKGQALRNVSEDDIDIAVSASTDRAPSGAGVGQIFMVVARHVASGEYYARVRFVPDGTVRVSLAKTIMAVDSILTPETTIPGLMWSASRVFRVRFTARGTNPTMLRTRVWDSAQTEPTTWDVQLSDSTPALQMAGSIGVSTYCSNSTAAPVTYSIDELLAITY